MKLVIILTSLSLLSACASQEGFVEILDTKAITDVCFVKHVTRTTVVNGRVETLLGVAGADVHVTETVDATYNDPNC